MTDPKGMSVDEILAACRRIDGEQSGDASVESSGPAAEAPAETQVAETSAAKKPAAGPAKKPGEMSVADMLAAARGEKAGGAKPAAESTEAAPAEAKPAGPAKKAGEMSVAEMLAAARGETSKPAAKPAAAKPAAAKASPKPAAKAPAKAVPAGPKDTQSILASARKQHQPGPMTKAEAAAKHSPAAPAKAKPVAPPMPEKPAYAKPQPVGKKREETSDRRGFILISLGSFLALGFTSLTLTNLFWVLGLARFMFPNILTEPPSRFRVGFPTDFAPGQVATKFKAKFGVWVINYEYNGQSELFALRSVCTHLGCTPNWLEAEQKFKCPCHGSGFYKDGINFEGPAPRPLERYAIRISDDGQIEIDKSKKFQEELGQWADPSSFVSV